MRFVVAGGAGFLGSHFSERLAREGHEVICLDNLVTGNQENLETLERTPGFTFLLQDICEPFEIEGRVDAVCDFASPASPVDFDRLSLEIMRVNSQGAWNCLELARRKGARYLVTSTSESYGDPQRHPQREDYWGNVNPVGPRSCYDESKRFTEALTMAYHRRYGLHTRIARIFNTYGPRMRLDDGRVVPSILMQALQRQPLTVFGDGAQTRSFCYVDDQVEGLRRLLDADDPYPVNIGNPEETTILAFAELAARLAGAPATITLRPLPQDDPRRRCPDIARARQLLRWEPKIALEEGLRRTLEWFATRMPVKPSNSIPA